MPQLNIKPKSYLYIAWLQALVGVLGSLYFEWVIRAIPCELCWYQRIFLFPLAIIFGIGILCNEGKRLALYVLPLCTLGGTIALYHTLLLFQLIKYPVTTCPFSVSCTSADQYAFGFIPMPFIAFIAFGVITVCTILYYKNYKDVSL